MAGGNPLRARAEARLCAGRAAFLRCDRGRGLYITDARLDEPLRAALEEDGLCAQRAGNLWRLTPGERALPALEDWLFGEADPLRLPGFDEALEEDWALLSEGLKRQELNGDSAALAEYEKRLRRRAAECLRTRRGGGLLVLCGRLLGRIEREKGENAP